MSQEYERAVRYFHNQFHQDSKGIYLQKRKFSFISLLRNIVIGSLIFILLGLIGSLISEYLSRLLISFMIPFVVIAIIWELFGGDPKKTYLSEFELDEMLKKYSSMKADLK